MTTTDNLLDKLTNPIGQPLRPDSRARLRAALLHPSPTTWDDAHTVCVRRTHTVWQLVLRHDPRCPTSLPDHPDPEIRWTGYHPDPFTLRTALLDPDTD